MTDNVENKDSMITAYTRISPDSSDLRFIKIVKFQHHADKTLTSIPFPSPLPNNTSASNHINLKTSDDKTVQLGKKIMQRLYNVGVLSRDVIQKCRESSSTVFSSESSVVASSSSSTQNNSILPNSNNGSENGDDHSLLSSPTSPTSTSSGMSTSNSILSKTSETSSSPPGNGKKKRGRKRKLSLDDKQIQIDNYKIYNCKIKLNMSHNDEKFDVRLQFVYKTKPKVTTTHYHNHPKNNSKDSNYINSGNYARNGSQNHNGNGVSSRDANSSFSSNNNTSPNGLAKLLNPSPTTETSNLRNGKTNHSMATTGSIIPLEEEEAPNMYITYDELINYLRDKIFFTENKKNLRGIEVKINYLLHLCTFKCLINETEIDI